ncbi:uncharacterized protein LACBIDRAFT_325349 [Laccaria bicolor S238N-H82]|uniref:Predicted protein n=1 Tax=Laccaria bicolor (strain S238N-H82 / ATCC MYA-4686) TaxID=486041 RepID=B0D4M4_LACBS|nr:uncharacterized protein LACBIDRAFT_325349 [Laccaria bicolor S238N-H82]EDR10588.1 predicted protein [Laccaria bicolor S238N-H82]|eukprot:XP_001879038.1 predicted protein [Laccaria bicolor S238N-H82]
MKWNAVTTKDDDRGAWCPQNARAYNTPNAQSPRGYQHPTFSLKQVSITYCGRSFVPFISSTINGDLYRYDINLYQPENASDRSRGTVKTSHRLAVYNPSQFVHLRWLNLNVISESFTSESASSELKGGQGPLNQSNLTSPSYKLNDLENWGGKKQKTTRSNIK